MPRFDLQTSNFANLYRVKNVVPFPTPYEDNSRGSEVPACTAGIWTKCIRGDEKPMLTAAKLRVEDERVIVATDGTGERDWRQNQKKSQSDPKTNSDKRSKNRYGTEKGNADD